MKKTVNTAHQEPETERRILQSAEKVFYRQGYDGARMQEIADEAGINKALLHYYFRSKERLFDAVFSDAVMRLVPPVFAVMNSNSPLMDKVRAFVDAYFNTVVNNPFLPGFVVHEMHRNPSRFSEIIRASRLLMLDGLQHQLDLGAESGELILPCLQSSSCSTFFHSAPSLLWLPEPCSPFPEKTTATISIFLRSAASSFLNGWQGWLSEMHHRTNSVNHFVLSL
uniref:Transcriptional regulator, TetR family n=1 Tax=Chlorobium phaeovibrioides (strain DSM 265 / 1930) TaxID=290318 RepID=A4SEG4_CHLPM